MLKRILSVLIVMSMLFSLVCINASAADYVTENTQLDVLKALEIVKGYGSDETKAFSVMKKSTFISFLLNMTEGGKYSAGYDADALKEAESLGIIAKAADVSDTDTLKKEEAIKMAMCLLGYGQVCEESGGYPMGYAAKAAGVGLTSGLSLSSEVTNAEAYNLLFNTMGTGISMPISYGPSGSIYVGYEDKTVLNVYRKIYEVNGIVTANRTSGLYETTATDAGAVMINEERFSDPNEIMYNFLGYDVLAYAKQISDTEYEIIYGEIDNKVKVIEIDSEDVKFVASDISSIEYFTDAESGKTHTVNIPKTVALLYNNVVCSDYTAADFKLPNGHITLIDNDGKGSFDVIKLDSYKAMIVSSVSVNSNVITGEYSYEGSLNKIELEKYKNSGDNVLFFLDGSAASINDVKAGDVLSVYASKSGENKSIVIYITRNKTNAAVTMYNQSEKEVICGDIIYEASDLYYEAAAKGESYAEPISSGNSYAFWFDKNGKIVAARVESTDRLQYGYVKSVAKTQDIEPTMVLRIFGDDAEWKTINCADRVRVNGENRAEIMNLKARIEAAQGGLIGYSLDKDGNINRLELPVAYADGVSKERLNVTPEQSHRYRWNNTSFDSYYYMTGNTKVFITPSSTPENEDMYDIGGNYYFSSDESVTYYGYGCDEYSFLDMVLVKRDASTAKKVGDSVYFVREVSEVRNNEGLNTKQITVSSAAYLGLSIMADNASVLADVHPGDLVKIHVNAKGYIDNLEHVYKISSGIVKEAASDLHTYTTVKGTVIKADPSNGRIMLDSVRGTKNVVSLKVSATVPVLIYDQARKTVTAGTLGDLSSGDYVIADISKSLVAGIYVIDFEE